MKTTQRIVIDLATHKRHLVKDSSDNFHTSKGIISSKDLQKEGLVESSKGGKFLVLKPRFIDLWNNLTQAAQTVNEKDIGMIITKTGIGKDSFVVDAGAGTGALALQLANIARQVVTYEIKESHTKIVEKNIQLCGSQNIELKCGSIYEGIKEKNVDVITLDVPEPWKALKSVEGALKVGGHLVVYLPNLTQVDQFYNSVKEYGFIVEETLEVIERKWVISKMQMRPVHEMLGHTAFLTFCRKV